MPDTRPSTLLVVPTPFEFGQIAEKLRCTAQTSELVSEVCGFGVVAAAARTMQLIAKHDPQRVLLVGIAGALSDELEVGTATMFRRVVSDGIGVGEGANHKSAIEMGWKQWQSIASMPDDFDDGIGDEIDLLTERCDAGVLSNELVSACAASADAHEAARRSERRPAGSAEDMEGFGVAMACRLADVPLQIIRGISNQAGDRDKRNWNIPAAIEAASDLAIKLLS